MKGKQTIYKAEYRNQGITLTRSFYAKSNAEKWLKSFYGGEKTINEVKI